MKRSKFILDLILTGMVIAKCSLCSGQISPMKLKVTYVGTFGTKGIGPGQFREPQDLSVDPGGFLYVADTQNQRIQKLDSKGRFIVEIGGFGWGKEQFDNPVAVSAKNGLDVLVADYYNQRIERYDKDLHYLASFTSSEEWPDHLKFGFPRDVDLSLQGELFCLDEENHRILKLDVQGNPQRSFGDFDAGEGRLVKPSCLMVSSKGNVYVSDEDKGHVVVFDIHGNYLYTLGDSILESPMGITEMSPDFILVVDQVKKELFVFRESGVFIGSFNDLTVMGSLFEEPVSIACWKDTVYVLDKKRCVVDLFHWTVKGMSPE
ncbi:NHL repeat-containing protein [bacterium]|nr:NHL repeat-containing protein [bacterium]